jgi:CDP-diacylglycerol---glycerol-3-phosphate 3-phosphatidyltransferase
MAKTIYNLKPAFQNLLRPLTTALWRMRITANQVTIFAALLSIAAGAVLLRFPGNPRALLVLPPVLFVRMALNAIDGMLAKEFALKSRLGALLNELGDVISDSALYLPLAFFPDFSPVLVVLIVVLAIISEMAGVLGLMIGATRRYDGPMGKSDRAFIFGAMGLALGFGAPAGTWQNIVLALMLLLLAVTIWNRARHALREGKPR